MLKLIDKGTLLLCCCILLFKTSGLYIPILSLLLTISITCAIELLHNTIIKLGITLFYYFLCVLSPNFCIFLPVFFYDAYGSTPKILYWISPCILIQVFHFGFSWEFAIIIAFCILAILLKYRTNAYLLLHKKYIMQRDASVELSNALQLQNRTLLENHDYEIRVVTLKERNRIAREIHDNVGHMLSRSILQVGALLVLHKDGPFYDALINLKETLSIAMTNIRQSVHDIRDDSFDLEQSIQELMKGLPDYKINLDYDVYDPISHPIKYCFMATIKEALSNVVKHSNATEIIIIIREHPAFYQLFIKDNGKELPVSIDRTEGMGLENITTRVASLNGTVHITTTQGFHIFIMIPKNTDTTNR